MRRSIIFLVLASLIATTFATTWVVKVGEGGMKFNPSNLRVVLGDTVIFNAVIGPHDVVQSTGPESCNASVGGFKSEKLFVNDNYAIKTEKPGKLWYYCSVNKHCSQNNMTGVIDVVVQSNQGPSPANSSSVKESTTPVSLVTLAVLVTSMFMAAMLL